MTKNEIKSNREKLEFEFENDYDPSTFVLKDTSNFLTELSKLQEDCSKTSHEFDENGFCIYCKAFKK